MVTDPAADLGQPEVIGYAAAGDVLELDGFARAGPPRLVIAETPDALGVELIAHGGEAIDMDGVAFGDGDREETAVAGGIAQVVSAVGGADEHPMAGPLLDLALVGSANRVGSDGSVALGARHI